MDRTMYSASIDLSFDSRFEFGYFYEEQKEIRMCKSISHK